MEDLIHPSLIKKEVNHKYLPGNSSNKCSIQLLWRMIIMESFIINSHCKMKWEVICLTVTSKKLI